MSLLNVLHLDKFEKEVLPDFYCNTFKDHLTLHKDEITVPHKHDFFLTVLFTKGKGSHEIDFEQYPIEPGTVFMLNPGQSHHWELSKDTDGYIFFHSKEFFDAAFTDNTIYDFPFFYSLLNPSKLSLKLGEIDYISDLFQSVYLANKEEDYLKKSKIISLLNLIYIELSRLYLKNTVAKLSKARTYSVHLRELELLIEANYKNEKSVGSYADMMHLTSRHLNRLTKEAIGKSPSELIIDRVILEAKRLLSHSKTSLALIAEDLGYEDYAYFSRLFSKIVGISPSKFQRNYHNK
ncbi:AraC family transcriptional regulator [Echinicola marina]|uniref:AraC family transcriptional regulator n=1 Tax=Echinicola marina TaxID=2859768 RepID=UPI001CF71ABC|nr:AraC family transcriptional regulator [Echinicola marina]UCS92075.1 AraC family transcriptional regulator [Echinicola marina]